MSKNALFIINPNASKGKGKEKAQEILRYLKTKNYEADFVYTTGIGHAELLACDGALDGYKTIIAVGGDGAVNEVANGIMRSGCNDKVKMGIVPVGRGNDFAWIAKIPKNTHDACDLIIAGEDKATDVGLCEGADYPEGKYFLNGAGFGFEPMVNFKAMEYKHLNGMPSYVAAFIAILGNPPKGYKLKLIIDGKEQALATQQISVANGRRMGSAFLMTPKAEIDDGKLDIMFTNRIYKGLSLVGLVWKFLRGKHVEDKKSFTYLNVSDVYIEGEKDEIEAHHDGEIFTKRGKNFHLQVLPGAIRLLRK